MELFKLVFKFAGKPPLLWLADLLSPLEGITSIAMLPEAQQNRLTPLFPFQGRNSHQNLKVLPIRDQQLPCSSAVSQGDIPELLHYGEMHREPASSCTPWSARISFFLLGGVRQTGLELSG